MDEFAEKFASDCAEGIQKSFANTELDYAALMNADTYSIGKSAGDEYVEGFNEALAQLQAAIAAEQDFAAASTAPKRYSETDRKSSAELSDRTASEIISVSVNNRFEVDGETLVEKTTVAQKQVERKKGKS